MYSLRDTLNCDVFLSDSPRLATNRPNVLAEDSSDEGESSRSRRRIIDDGSFFDCSSVIKYNSLRGTLSSHAI